MTSDKFIQDIYPRFEALARVSIAAINQLQAEIKRLEERNNINEAVANKAMRELEAEKYPRYVERLELDNPEHQTMLAEKGLMFLNNKDS